MDLLDLWRQTREAYREACGAWILSNDKRALIYLLEARAFTEALIEHFRQKLNQKKGGQG